MKSPVWLTRLDPDADNIIAIMNWSAYQGAGTHALRIASALFEYFFARPTRLPELTCLLTALENHVVGITPLIRARALNVASLYPDAVGDFQTARKLDEEGLRLARESGDEVCLGRALWCLGWDEVMLGDLERARVHLREGVELARRTGDWLSGDALAALAQCEPRDTIRALLEENVVFALEHSGPSLIAKLIYCWVPLSLNAEDWEPAEQCYRASASYWESTGNRTAVSWPMCALAGIAVRRGQYTEATTLLRQAKIWSEVPRHSARVVRLMGILARHQSRYAQAMQYFEEALAISQRLPTQTDMAFVLSEMALVARDQCNYERARALCKQSLEIYQTLGRTASRGYVLINLASIE